MKKLFLALLALPLLASITACSSDDSQPNVNINITYGNAKVVDNQVYVVKPDTFRIDRVDVTAVNPDKKATNGPVSYFLNAVPLGTFRNVSHHSRYGSGFLHCSDDNAHL